jgi:hypothetical protein
MNAITRSLGGSSVLRRTVERFGRQFVEEVGGVSVFFCDAHHPWLNT